MCSTPSQLFILTTKLHEVGNESGFYVMQNTVAYLSAQGDEAESIIGGSTRKRTHNWHGLDYISSVYALANIPSNYTLAEGILMLGMSLQRT